MDTLFKGGILYLVGVPFIGIAAAWALGWL